MQLVRFRSEENTGTRPNTSPVTTETSTVNSKTRPSMRISPARVVNLQRSTQAAAILPRPATSPSTPPASESRVLSVSSWRINRPRPAPRAARIASLSLATHQPRERKIRNIRARDQQARDRRCPAVSGRSASPARQLFLKRRYDCAVSSIGGIRVRRTASEGWRQAVVRSA